MQDIVALISNPLTWKLLGGYWAFSAFTAALPAPKPADNPSARQMVYPTFFRFVHGLAGNIDRAATSFKVPGSPSA